jgi:hypothetical protein
MRVPLGTILCMLGLCVCFDIVLRVFNIHVSWWNGTFLNSHPKRSNDDDKDDADRPQSPTPA